MQIRVQQKFPLINNRVKNDYQRIISSISMQCSQMYSHSKERRFNTVQFLTILKRFSPKCIHILN